MQLPVAFPPALSPERANRVGADTLFLPNSREPCLFIGVPLSPQLRLFHSELSRSRAEQLSTRSEEFRADAPRYCNARATLTVCQTPEFGLASGVLRSVKTLPLVLVLAACTSNNSAQLPEADFFVAVGQAFGLRVGDTAGVVTSTSIDLVRFNAVFDDSRCPVDAACVQAGYATVSLTVQTALEIREITIQVPPDGSAEQEVEELTIDLIELRPQAQSGVAIEPLSYVAIARVRETGSILP